MSTFVTLVLDKSGSMNAIREDTIGGFNSYIAGLKKDKKDRGEEYLFTLLMFDSNSVDIVHRAISIDDVPELTDKTYVPGASTPLIDAACKAIKATEEKAGTATKVIVVIQTDGQENSSLEFKHADLVEMIKKKTAEGWDFVYLGAGIDAFQMAGSLGIRAGKTMSYGRRMSEPAFKNVLRTTLSYGVTGQSVGTDFTAEERLAVGENEVAPNAPVDPQSTQATSEPARKIVDDFKI